MEKHNSCLLHDQEVRWWDWLCFSKGERHCADGSEAKRGIADERSPIIRL